MADVGSVALQMAEIIGNGMGTCIRRNVGAVLVVDGRIREVGWNGMERSPLAVKCQDGGCPRGELTVEEQPHGSGYSNCVYLHAEFNVAEEFRMRAEIRNTPGWALARGVTIYTSSVPCEDCTAYARAAGIKLEWEQL